MLHSKQQFPGDKKPHSLQSLLDVLAKLEEEFRETIERSQAEAPTVDHDKNR